MTYRKPKGRFFWLPLAKYIKHPILPQTKRTVPLVREWCELWGIGLECWDLIDKFAWGSRLCDRATAVMIN